MRQEGLAISAANSEPSRCRPGDRYLAVDVHPRFALLGILAMNIVRFRLAVAGL